MGQIQSLKLIDVSAPAADACCGGGACGCGAADEAVETVEAAAPALTADYAVEGMTCGHCVDAVGKEVGGIPGVETVSIDLVPGGRSTVRVGSAAPVGEDAIRAAVEEAGYTLV